MKTTRHLLAILLMLLPLGKAMAYDFCVDGVYYQITSPGYSVSVTYGEYSSGTYSGELVIPSTVTNEGTTYTVTGITASACYYCTGLNSITIPRTITSIGSNAFYLCYNLKTVHIEDVAAWCNVARSGTSSNPLSCSTTTDLYINGELATHLEIPSTVTTLNDSFRSCRTIRVVTIDSGVCRLEDSFTSCTGLVKVTIPGSVSYISGKSFSGCSSLQVVVMEDGDTSLSLGDDEYWSGRYDDTYHRKGAFYGCPIFDLYVGRNLTYSFNPFLHNYDGDYYYSTSHIRNVEFGPSVTYIYLNFEQSQELKSISLHSATPPSVATNFSQTTYENARLIIPWEADATYRSIDPWQNFKNIRHHKTGNDLLMDNAKVFAGQTLWLPVELENQATINSLGGIITLPEGMEIARNAKGKFNIALNDLRASADDAFTVSTNQLSDGSVKFLIVSTDGTDISGNSGTIINIPVVIGQELEGEYEVRLSAVQMSDTDGKLINSPNAYSTVTVEQYMLGDINRDWQIAPNDITLAIKAYIGETPADFCFLAADINTNGALDPADITAIIKLYLEGGETAEARGLRAPAESAGTSSETTVDDGVFLSDVTVTQGGEYTINLAMDLQRSDYTSLGGIITLPEGFTFARNDKGKPVVTKNNDVLEYHTVSSNLLSDRQMKFYIGSTDLDLIAVGLSTLISVKVVADNPLEPGDYTYAITSLQLSDYDANLYNASDAQGTLHVGGDLTVGVDGTTALATTAEGMAYDLQGRPVTTRHHGIAISRGKKLLVR